MNALNLEYRIAGSPEEFEQIHRLNYRTFVEEIPQHEPNPERMLVDVFHEKNTYYICLHGDKLVGMLAMADQRPFSLDNKITNLESHLPPDSSVCEFRLLAVEPEYRHTSVFAGLFKLAAQHAIGLGHNLGVISGTTRQIKLYRRMGFIPFAYLVGVDGAMFQPMYVTLDVILGTLKELDDPKGKKTRKSISFLPGPVNIHPNVQETFFTPPESHRSARFMKLMGEAKELFKEFTGARNVEIMVGSGTLANDVAGAQLKLLDCPGLMLSNGEFGERLIDHAERHGLRFRIYRAEWGQPYDDMEIERLLDRHSEIGWVWSTHCETSTGVLNNMDCLAAICRSRDVKLCMDCTSSVGVVPVNMSHVWMATSVSGKGIGSFPGLSMVFYNHMVKSDRHTPRYIDLGYYAENEGVPFTHSSNLLTALYSAVRQSLHHPCFDQIRRRNMYVRQEILRLGFDILAPEEISSPGVISILIPPPASSMDLGADLEKMGHILSYRSGYLRKRNIVQVCLMGENADEHFQDMISCLVHLATKHHIQRRSS